MERLHGVIAAMATPFADDGSVDEKTLRELTDRLIDDGVHGLIPCGSTGEFAAMTHEERRQVTEVVIAQVAGRVPVVPHTGAMTTSEAIELSRHAEQAGAAGVMVVAPYYEALSAAEAKDYYRQVAASVAIDVMVYNLPAATGINMAPEDIRQLAEETPNIRYVKDTSGDFDQATVLIHSLSDVVTTFVGMDTAYLASLTEGADGAVVGAANFLGPALAGIYDRVQAGDLASAQSSWAGIFAMMKALGGASAYVQGVKGAMRIARRPVGDPRAPIRPLEGMRARQFETLLSGIDPHLLTGGRP
jgi:4-hydroxy-tetrahydrodipicolinate synthase